MKKFLPLLILFSLFALAIPAHAETRVFANTSLGACSGYNLPCFTLGGRVEHDLTSKIELQGFGNWIPTDKTSGGSGNTYQLGTRGIYWTKRIGLTANFNESWLRSQKFDKNTFYTSFGVVGRFRFLDADQRLYASYLLPTGGYDPKTGIESSRGTGLVARWEVQMSKHIDVFWDFKILRLLNQGNPFCDGSLPGPKTCPRKAIVGGDSLAGISYRF